MKAPFKYCLIIGLGTASLFIGYLLGFQSADQKILFQANVQATYIANSNLHESYERSGEVIFGNHFLVSNDIVKSEQGLLAMQSLYEWNAFNSNLKNKKMTRQYSGMIHNSLILDLPDEVRLKMHPIELPSQSGRKLYLFYFRDVALLLIEKNRNHHNLG
ncbi:hypothetical protein EK599_07675 [Vibrio sp. T187]|uniref:hypothetical protein n=1 Tax=Vibrio TaxID=662 RepID=UPI0010CA106B|nr:MULTISPECIES: hypothetical protein [Vibrio]MBW3695571.1 hypothetical protein [Vibrio sp. T187]